VFIGKFIDQTFYSVGRVRACAPLESYWRPQEGKRSPVKKHWRKAFLVNGQAIRLRYCEN